MSLASYDLTLVFNCAVELAEATDSYRPDEYAPILATSPPDRLEEDADAVGCWHEVLDAIELASNRLKRALGAKGPLDSADYLRDQSTPTWEEFQSHFKYSAHPPTVRQALRKLANAAIDLSGYASIQIPELSMRERGMRLLQQGLAQLWAGMTAAQRAEVKPLLARTHVAFGWPANPTEEPPRYAGPEGMAVEDQYRVIDTTGGFAARTPDFLEEQQRMLNAAHQRSSRPSRNASAAQEAGSVEPRPGPIFDPGDLDRTLNALDRVFQDEDMPEGDVQLQQNKLVERLREHDVTRALALALIDDLIARGVFRARESFVDLNILVRLNGEQTDTVTPNRYLHTTRQSWYGYLAERKAASAAPHPPPATTAGGIPPSAPEPPSIGNSLPERINHLHGLAVRCVNIVLRLHYLRHCGDGIGLGLAALNELCELVRELPPLPLAEDPFCGEEVVDVAGVTATSAHVAAFAIAQGTWEAVHLTSLGPATGRWDAEGEGAPYTRIAFAVERRSPTEVPWSREVWQSVCEELDKYSTPDAAWFEAALALEQNRAARRLRDRAESIQEGPPSKPVRKGPESLRSWTQPDLDAAIREYKAKRATQYNELVEGIRQGRPGAQKAARQLYGRNAIARALGVKARAMVSKSEPWQEIAAELQLSRSRNSCPPFKRSKRIGLSIAEEKKALDDLGRAQVLDQLVHKETIALLQRKLPPEVAEEAIWKLERGEMTDDGARELIDLYQLQQQDDKAKKVRRSPC
jgi:hypothetical protein